MSSLNPNANVFVPSFNRKPVYTNEIEAKCEAVVEILNEAALLCDELDEHQSNTNSNKTNNNNIITHEYDDEEELLEMFEMQEECRLEMMKFYVQAQNPELFEEVYYGVNYSGEQSNNSNGKQYNHHHHNQQVNSQQRDQQQNKINGLANMMKDNLNLKECSNP